MGYNDTDEIPPEPAEPLPLGLRMLAIGVRAVGLVVLLVGLWAGIKVILEAWALYEEPQRIERLADAIASGSNLDGVIGSLTSPEPGSESRSDGLRLSYFAAWFIGLLLIFVIGSLAMAAITTGGQLALYDLQVRQHSRAVIREVRRLRRAA